jgi:hypothetical protein
MKVNRDRQRQILDRQFQQADIAIERTVATFVKRIEGLMGRWSGVASTYIAEGVLLELCEELSRLTDEPFVRNHAGEATIKLANALADYRDSQFVERFR